MSSGEDNICNDGQGITFIVFILYWTVRNATSWMNVLDFLLMKGYSHSHHLGDKKAVSDSTLIYGMRKCISNRTFTWSLNTSKFKKHYSIWSWISHDWATGLKCFLMWKNKNKTKQQQPESYKAPNPLGSLWRSLRVWGTIWLSLSPWCLYHCLQLPGVGIVQEGRGVSKEAAWRGSGEGMEREEKEVCLVKSNDKAVPWSSILLGSHACSLCLFS